MRRFVPWWARIAAKLVLSRIPAGYQRWRKLNIFAHGEMHRAPYALSVFEHHFRHYRRPVVPTVALEIGPGDSISSAIIAAAHGAVRTHLIDAGSYATPNMEVYRSMAQHLRSRSIAAPALEGVADLEGVLRVCNATYGTRGLASLREIPSGSVTFLWSHAVLEHIRRAEFADLAAECRRVLHPDGICSHQIDLKDHLGGALNNMRISSRVWEQDWMASSGFYTNRLKMSEILAIFSQAGFAIDVGAIRRWEKLPTRRSALASEFASLSDEELLVNGFEVVLRPN